MKVERTEPKVKFVPIVITLETQEEIDKMYAVLVHCKINIAVNINHWWKALDWYKTNDYRVYFNKLDEVVK